MRKLVGLSGVPDHVLIEEDGRVFNFSLADILNPPAAVSGFHAGTGMRMAGTLYAFDPGGTLGEHAHGLAGLHTIEVTKGKVIVRKESGDETIVPGTVVQIAVGEKHSVEALEDSETLHRLVGR